MYICMFNSMRGSSCDCERRTDDAGYGAEQQTAAIVCTVSEHPKLDTYSGTWRPPTLSVMKRNFETLLGTRYLSRLVWHNLSMTRCVHIRTSYIHLSHFAWPDKHWTSRESDIDHHERSTLAFRFLD